MRPGHLPGVPGRDRAQAQFEAKWLGAKWLAPFATEVVITGHEIMDYLFVKFIWWLVLAFALGGFVGWYSCGRQQD